MNLYLGITGGRADGYHELELVTVPVSVYDTVSMMEEDPGAGVRMEPPRSAEDIAPPETLGAVEDNLVLRAALAFAGEAFGQDAPTALDLTLGLDKRIPAGAGLGGGSGNAGGVLMALNMMHGHPLGPDRLHRTALSLGADVPFFLDARPALCRGVGEVLLPLAGLPRLELLLLRPAFTIATGEAYGWVREAGAAHDPPRVAAGAPPWRGETPPSPREVADGMYNRFESVLFPRFPQLRELTETLRGEGALRAMVSGSGSVVFGVFPGAAARDAAQQALMSQARERGWWMRAAHTLPRHRYDLIF